MAKRRAAEPQSRGGRTPPPPRKSGMTLAQGTLLCGLLGVLLAFLGVLAGGQAASSGESVPVDNVGATVCALLTAPEPSWWSKQHGTVQDALARLRKAYPADVQVPGLGSLPPSQAKTNIYAADNAAVQRNESRLDRALAAAGQQGALRGFLIRFRLPGLDDVSAGARPEGGFTPQSTIGAGSSAPVGVAQMTASSPAGGTFAARVYHRSYLNAANQQVGDVYAVFSEASLQAGALGAGMWVFLTPLLVAVSFGGVFFLVNRAGQGMTTLARDLEAVGRGKLDHKIAVSVPGEVGYLQRVTERTVRNLQLIQTTGSGDIDEALEKELELTTQIHQSLRPADAPRIPGYELETLFKAGREIGGDYFDYIELDENRTALVIADCAEGIRGVPAAMIMAMTRAFLKSAVDPETGPAAWLTEANRRLARDLKSGMAVTALVVVLDSKSGEVVAASAGHRPMVLWRQGKTATINPNGIALGLDIGPVFEKTIEDKQFVMQKGDRLVLYTDGVVSAKNEAGESYGEERFIESVRKQGAMNSAAFVNFVAAAVDAFSGGAEQNDDITISTLKRVK